MLAGLCNLSERTKIVFGVLFALVLAFSLAGVSYYFPESKEQFPISYTEDLPLVPSFSVSGVETRSEPVFSMYLSTDLENITLRKDGTVEPQDAPIRRDGNVYTLTDDIVNRTLWIQRDSIVVDGAGHTFQGFINNIRYAAKGIVLQNVSDVRLTNMQVTQFWSGISVTVCSNITITGTKITNIGSTAIMFDSCNNSIISDSIIDDVAIALEFGNTNGPESLNSTIARNTITNAAQGITIGCSFSTITENSFENIYLPIGVRGNQITVSKNSLVNGIGGIYLTGSYCSVYGNSIANFSELGISVNLGTKNSFYENSVSDSEFAIMIRNSADVWVIENNTFYHNNFVNNTQNILVESPSYQNYWDDCFEGNYWSDYNGTDADGNGIGDTSYVIDDNNIDSYPLMTPYKPVQQSNHMLWVHLGLAGLAVVTVVFIVIGLANKKTKQLLSNS